jgi:tRNA (uracil-5-)-methyltransferase TRM9
MLESVRQELLAINRRFYQQGAEGFSATRQRPWEGWRQLLPELAAARAGGSFLDLGCGNGRFALFLAAEGLLPASYLGIDGSPSLLAEARERLPGAPCSFLELDLGDGLPAILPGQPYDLVALFGVLHHLPGQAARRNLLADLASRLAPGGLLIPSFWLLDRFPGRFEKLRRAAPPFAEDALEPGDALLSFAGRPDLLRYCHFPDDAEIDAACSLPGCEELRRFRADGPSGGDNLYAVLQRRRQR